MRVARHRGVKNENRMRIHLISLDLRRVNIDYLAQFLLEAKTYLPRLTVLEVNFTRNKTRHNCSNVKRIITNVPVSLSRDIYQYIM